MAVDWEFLKEKKGGLPMYAWAIIAAVAAIAVFYIIRGRAAMNNVAGNTGTVSTDPYAAFTAAALQPTTSSTGTGIDTGTVETNTTWLSKVVNYLLNKGVDPLTAQNAAQTYLDGGVPLSPDQAALVSQGITQFGLPPDGVFGIPSVQTPTPPPVTTPTNATVVGYIKSSGRPEGEEVAQLLSDGSIHGVTGATYAALGRPATITVPYAQYSQYRRLGNI